MVRCRMDTYSEAGRGCPDACSFGVEDGGLIDEAAAN